MPTISVLGAKGGCGASLVATNLAIALTPHGPTLLVDLHSGDGGDDLLLDLRPERSWADLLAVAGELELRHLDLALLTHSSGLRFLAAPRPSTAAEASDLEVLLQGLAACVEWLVLDVPPWMPAAQAADILAVVTTADPPALRNTQRLLDRWPAGIRSRARLVLNQFTRAHPGDPASIAAALACPLLAVLPPDARSVGFQVSFGRACSLDPQSSFGRAATSMARSLAAGRVEGRTAA